MEPTNRIPFIKFIPGIVWFIIVCFILFLPGHDVPQMGDWLQSIDFDKVIHMSMFGILITLLCWPFYRSGISPKKKNKYFILIALAGCFWGYSSELIQKYWAIGRDYELMDWLADSLGCFLAWLFSKKVFI
jgi:hypothetical protein